jgi:hypothetical protein
MNAKIEDDEFHRGENTPELTPADAVAQLVANRSQGVVGEVESMVILANGLRNFRKDAAKLNEFLLGLRIANVVSQEEMGALAGDKSPSRVSKLIKVAEFRDELLHPEICPWLSPGYSCLYEFALFVEEMRKGQKGVGEVINVLKTCDGEVTRKWLIEQRKMLLEQAGVPDANETDIDDASDEDDDNVSQGDASDDSSATEASNKTKTNVAPASAVFWSVQGNVSSLLKTSDESVAPRWLSELQSMEKNACLFVHGKLNALFAMAPVIAKCGFRQPSRVILLTDPSDGDATAIEAIAIYQRGTAKIDSKFKDWHDESPPIELATSALDGASGRWVYLFAQSEAEGWDCIFGDENH